MAIQRQYGVGYSLPSFSRGRCPKCWAGIPLNLSAPLGDDEVVSCEGCGANTRRRLLIMEALALRDTLTWGLFASDLYIWDWTEVPLGDFVSYNLEGLQVSKWQHQETIPSSTSGERYVATLAVVEPRAYFYVSDNLPSETPDVPVPKVNAGWYRFGLRQPGAVPAWRQSLFGAATLIDSHPSAAIVLVAAGFESFFIERMRIAWHEQQLDGDAFEHLNERNPPLSSLVTWLPVAVRERSLISAPDLYQRWKEIVNQRRNNVMHRAQVHFTSEEASESMRVALECIMFIDDAALVRPHTYYTRP